MKEKVKEALEKIKPSLEAHGGGVELVEVTDDGVVKVKLTGACGGCPMREMTLWMGREETLREGIPGGRRVEAV